MLSKIESKQNFFWLLLFIYRNVHLSSLMNLMLFLPCCSELLIGVSVWKWGLLNIKIISKYLHLFACSKLVGDIFNVPQTPARLLFLVFVVSNIIIKKKAQSSLFINGLWNILYWVPCTKYSYSFAFLKTIMECFKNSFLSK